VALDEEAVGGRSELFLACGHHIRASPHPQPTNPERGEGEVPCSMMEGREEGPTLR
jgi:hypothetical protein